MPSPIKLPKLFELAGLRVTVIRSEEIVERKDSQHPIKGVLENREGKPFVASEPPYQIRHDDQIIYLKPSPSDRNGHRVMKYTVQNEF